MIVTHYCFVDSQRIFRRRNISNINSGNIKSSGHISDYGGLGHVVYTSLFYHIVLIHAQCFHPLISVKL